MILAEWLNETTFTRKVMEPKPRLELDRDEEHDVAVALHCLDMLANKRKQDEQEWFRVAMACAEISDELQEPFEEFSKSAVQPITTHKTASQVRAVPTCSKL